MFWTGSVGKSLATQAWGPKFVKSRVWRSLPITAALDGGERRHADPWNSLAGRPSQISEFQVQWGTLSLKMKVKVKTPSIHFRLKHTHAHIHVPYIYNTLTHRERNAGRHTVCTLSDAGNLICLLTPESCCTSIMLINLSRCLTHYTYTYVYKYTI